MSELAQIPNVAPLQQIPRAAGATGRAKVYKARQPMSGTHAAAKILREQADEQGVKVNLLRDQVEALEKARQLEDMPNVQRMLELYEALFNSYAKAAEQTLALAEAKEREKAKKAAGLPPR